MSPQEIQLRLEKMKGKTFVFTGQEHIIESYWINETGKQFSVKTNHLEIKRTYDNAHVFFTSFKPVEENHECKTVAEKINGNVSHSVEPAPNHTPSSVIVYCTTDYSRFYFLKGNREINQRKVKKIIRDIQGGNDMLMHYPLQVKEDAETRLGIFDGQHRFVIDQKLKRPVYYILVTEEKSMSDIAKVNSNVEKWNVDHYLNCYSENEHYQELQKFMKAYDFPVSMALRLLAKGEPGVEGSSADLMDKFKYGHFEVSHAAAAYTIAEECKMFSAYKGWTERGFVIAIFRIKKAGLISVEDLLAAYKKHPEMLTAQKSYKQYVWNLEQIVNVGRQKRITII